ncbi:hypothetical protein [Enterococcus malodoratus]|uniref:Uncharacterized protein n=2 Tax=Enterococcus malodoratus TaxID=71451 RepID=R2NVP2_9ENTE|nr:hypothetical protein [Enterococcus malodoratus]EOH75078.1 hypothetical protein UAI_03319 [Enterococcus malodoratus ATCC 43197]EOT66980.1 hypothetical protein I585_02501 [Enterococcus malodoratus ATCC 43197]SPX03898.1 Uncharacterised protein [Enterococcus malodoratus]STD69768.1 Uncharacterised protein [Enterococcus malodoratus]
MSETLFTPRQLFTLKRKTIEKRTSTYYEETRDEAQTVKILIALQVRDELGEADFSFFMYDLVRRLFMKTKSTRALRRYYVYFKEYFEAKEWRLLTLRLFPIKTYIAEKLEQLYTQFIKEPLEGLAGS